MIGRQIEESKVVGDRRTIPGDLLGNFFLGGPGIDQGPVGVGEFHRIQVVSLDILHDGNLEALLGGEIGDHHRNRSQARRPARPPTALAHDQFVARARFANDQRLQNAVTKNRCGQALELSGVKDAPGLIGIRIDILDPQFPCGPCVLRAFRAPGARAFGTRLRVGCSREFRGRWTRT